MKAKIIIATLVLGVLVGTQAYSGDGAITGTIKFEGQAPKMKVIKMSADAKCEAKNAGKKILAESLVIGADMTMANVLVRIKTGLPEGQTYTAPAEPVVINQIGCMYVPHVAATMPGQEVKFLNSDGTLHNVHGLPKVNAEFNVPMPGFKKEISRKFDKVEDPFAVKCDVHPWMKGYVAVQDNPFTSVTAQDGKFTIKGLAAGDYEVEIWHEKLGTKTGKVTVGAGETKTLDFTMAKPTTVGMLNAIMIVE